MVVVTSRWWSKDPADQSLGVGRVVAARPTPRGVGRRRCWPCAVPVVVYCAINVVKFDSLISVPWDRQQYSQVVEDRREFLDESGNSFFGVQFAPTTLVQYLRPDGLAFSGVFPWIEAPDHADVIGDARFDTIEPTASVPASMPVIVVLAVSGRGRRSCAPAVGARRC